MNLITVKSAHNQADLVVLKSCLESGGIECFLKNELTAQVINYVPAFLVDLQVLETDLEWAKEIMKELGETIENGKKYVCPECGSGEIKMQMSMMKKIQFLFALILTTLVFSNLPTDKLFKQSKLKCKDCKVQFYL